MVMPQFVVTADDREWFHLCRRAWDFGARARRSLVPAPAREPSATDSPPDALGRAVLDALAVHYFPGMWSWDRTIVDPLVLAAYERAGGPAGGQALLDAHREWAAGVDRFTPLRVEVDIDVHVPDPVLPHTHLATLDGAPVRYRDRIQLVMVDDADEIWVGAHRIVREFASADELALDERALLQCWAWEEIELAMTVAGVQYTELRVDPPTFRRTGVRRSEAEKTGASTRLGRTALDMLSADPVIEPTPAWSHCSRCDFRAPCLAINRGESPEALLATLYRPRPPDVLEEGRLGGMSWGMGRGAAPPRL